MKTLRIARYKHLIALLVMLQILAAIVILVNKQSLPPVVPLFYGMPTGAQQLAPVNYLLLLPGLTIGIMAIAAVMAQYVHDKFIDTIMIGVMVIANILSLFSLLKILAIVGSIRIFTF